MKLLFPTVIHELKVDNFRLIKEDLVKFVYGEREKDPRGLRFSNMGGWQSQPTYKDYDNILFSTVKNTLMTYFSQNVLDMSKEIVFEGLWMNINKKGAYNATHDHPNCHMAGAFWINSPEGCGNFECQSPHSYNCGQEISVYTPNFREKTNSYGSYGFLPIEGSIMLFPASLNHRVTPNQSDEDRISSSFNLTFKI
tara:strand:+ start:118 stop:705 length:588 start_codon:yes stop_codon:yes gene_type:complete